MLIVGDRNQVSVMRCINWVLRSTLFTSIDALKTQILLVGVCCLLRGLEFWCESHVESCVLLSVSNVGIREFFTGKCHALWYYDGERIQFGNLIVLYVVGVLV
jgi:hypothetical protein